MEESNKIMIGMDFAKPGGDLTALTVSQGCGSYGKIIGAFIIPPDHMFDAFRYMVHYEFSIEDIIPPGQVTEDAEFEIIQPKQLLDANKI